MLVIQPIALVATIACAGPAFGASTGTNSAHATTMMAPPACQTPAVKAQSKARTAQEAQLITQMIALQHEVEALNSDCDGTLSKTPAGQKHIAEIDAQIAGSLKKPDVIANQQIGLYAKLETLKALKHC